MVNGNNINGYNSCQIDRIISITTGALAHASNLNKDLGSDILYVPESGALLNQHTANVKAIVENRLKTKFKKIIGA